MSEAAPTSSERPLVIQTEHLDAECARWLAERARLEVCPSEDPRFASLLSSAHGVVIRTYTRVDERFLSGAPNLRVVGRAGVGLDNVDVGACAQRGIAVVYTPAANTRAVVEYVFALIFDAVRPRLFLHKSLPVGEWKRVRGELIAPRQLDELTVGVLGLGQVGGGVARAAAGFDMRVLYHDVREVPEPHRFGAQPVGFEELLGRADVLSVHVDGRARNRGLLDAAALGRCKPGVVLINTSRGMVIDPMALADFMIAHRGSGAQALLDVHDPEPFDAAYPLLDLPNVHLAPHIAAATACAHRNMSWVVRDVWRVLCGEVPEHSATIK